MTLLQIYCSVCFERFFKIAEYFRKVMGKTWLPQSPCAPEHWLAERWRTHL